jgi:protein MpaA
MICRPVLISLAIATACLAGGCSNSARRPASPAVKSAVAPDVPPAVADPREPHTVPLGTSVHGAPLTMYVFGDGPDVTLIFSAIHGDEPAAAFVGRKLLEHLQQHPEATSGHSIAVFPVVNPDGLAAGTRTNANGVDCNRNFPAANWKHRPGFLRSNPGTRPASEPETRAVMKAIETLRPARIVSIHSGLRCNNYDGPAQGMAAVLAKHNGYPVQSSVGYATPGSFGSWAGGDLGLPVVTLELPRSNNGEKAWAENREGLLELLRSPASATARQPGGELRAGAVAP